MREIRIHSAINPEYFWVECIQPSRGVASVTLYETVIVEKGPWPALCHSFGIELGDDTPTHIDFDSPRTLERWNACAQEHVKQQESANAKA